MATALQMRYHELQEAKRHNRATEEENIRHNKRSERDSENRTLSYHGKNEATKYAADVAASTADKNRNLQEELGKSQLAEQKRHNIFSDIYSGIDTGLNTVETLVNPLKNKTTKTRVVGFNAHY